MKKLPLFCALSFIFCIGITFAYTEEDVSSANYLAEKGLIKKQTVASEYRLDDKILRQEIIGTALKIKGISLPENYVCKKYFADAVQNDWVCRALEIAADNGIITKSNTYANPGKYVSRSEALAMIMSASGKSIKPIGVSKTFTYLDANEKIAEAWQSNVMETARQLGVINPLKKPGTPVKYYWKHNEPANRAEVFQVINCFQ